MTRRPPVKEVLAALEAEGLLDTGSETRVRTALRTHQFLHAATPWFVKALAGFGAWLAAAFFLSFLGCIGLLDNEAVLGVFGLGFCVAATLLRRRARGLFLQQLALALCLASVVMVAVGLGEAMRPNEDVGAAVIVLVLGAVLLVTFPDAILRFLMTAGVAASAVFLLWRMMDEFGVQLGLLVCAVLVHVLFLEGARLRLGPRREWVGPASYGLACFVLGSLLTLGFSRMLGVESPERLDAPDGLLTLGLTAVTLYTAWRVMRELKLEASGVAGAAVFAALVLTALMTLNTPAVIGAVGMMVLGFHRRGVDLVGLSAAFLLAAGGWYYYDLSLTLLAKAVALLGSGLVFLGLRLFLLRRFPAAVAEVR
ncbi:DUF4401 domain-containing protein [Pyxidicoccus fallax]|uniref:DUF4401 domain-containing protein n=1 Tax=Pyxidicoccus fallax TaxID=394095 RepID=A0A848LIB0_9BACT|nr:DUF4401 domain-containing protein [Pyxidicoccus fallax]NMO17454.1 DUF4401 domain-containing protein [Pyxidicoccus fallax]NPC82315.1 DUF4401 domain-containing protein [Pyxidicoccus fallax]